MTYLPTVYKNAKYSNGQHIAINDTRIWICIFDIIFTISPRNVRGLITPKGVYCLLSTVDCLWLYGEIHQNTVLSTQQSSELTQTRTRCGPSVPRWGEAPTSSTAPAASLSSGRRDEERSLHLQPGESYQPSQGKDWGLSPPVPSLSTVLPRWPSSSPKAPPVLCRRAARTPGEAQPRGSTVCQSPQTIWSWGGLTSPHTFRQVSAHQKLSLIWRKIGKVEGQIWKVLEQKKTRYQFSAIGVR